MIVRKNKDGQAIVEMALVLPIFLIVVLGIIDFGILLHMWATLNQQCVQAARAGSKRIHQLIARGTYTANTHAPLSEVEAAFWRYRSPLMATESYTVTFNGVGTSSPKVVVSAQYRTTLYTPLLGNLLGGQSGDGRITISAQAEENKE